MAVTYDKIATNTVSSSVSSVTFSSIPATYTDLVLITTSKLNTPNDLKLKFNSDSGSNYSYTYLSGTGSSAVSGRETNRNDGIQIDAYAAPGNNNNNVTIVQIQNYSNATTFKTLLSRANNAASGVDAMVGLWRSTSAISTIEISLPSATFSSGSIQTIYGILKA